MKYIRFPIIFALSGLIVASISCKSHPARPPLAQPPEAPRARRVPPLPSAKPTPPKEMEANRPSASRSILVPPGSAVATGISPFIRIGLMNDVHTARITAKGKMSVEVLTEGDRRPPEVVEQTLFVALQAAPSGENAAVPAFSPETSQSMIAYRVQVASFREEARAHSMKQELESRLALPVTVMFNQSTKTYRVRLGEFSIRSQAEALVERLQEAGYANVWVISDEMEPAAPRVARLDPSREMPSNKASVVVRSLGGDGVLLLPLPSSPSAPISLIRISPVDPQDFLVLNHLAYRGVLEVVGNVRGRLNIVNELDLEDYLKGVVPNEMPPAKFDALEALKAQAVAARTYALKNQQRFLREGYQLCATIACQLYRGVDSERSLSTTAVEATRRIVLKYRGELIDSLYTSTCGGQTEDASNIFRTLNAPYLRSAFCPPENAPEINPRLVAVSGYHLKWRVRMTREDLEKTLQKTLPLDELIDLQPLNHGISGRVIEMKVKGRGRDFVLRGLEVKSALGLKDTLFTLTREYDRRGEVSAFEFSGRGWGHGVGLCQTGAFGLALDGKNFESILKTYYHGVDVAPEDFHEY